MEADRVMQWLNGKELRSVVFVSLAMMAHGLELSGAAFVHGAGGGTAHRPPPPPLPSYRLPPISQA
uniref:Uncharacterized protein n=1 Tax=Oryza sativa subsp. japonica TaxID=39947 RepID=Q8H3H5_ORYSJ|nr:hypothetical protein [Oryza sativa Japonica Group]